MKKLLKLGASALVLTLAANAASADGKLVIYNWFEYLPQDLIDKFVSESGVEVTMDTFDSNEAMLASLKAGKIGTYDVAVPSDYMVDIMGGEGMLDTFTQDEMPNFVGVASFTRHGLDDQSEMDYDEIREKCINDHAELAEMWDEDLGDWQEDKEDEEKIDVDDFARYVNDASSRPRY